MANAKKNLEKIQKKLKFPVLKQDLASLKKAGLLKASFQLTKANYDDCAQWFANLFSTSASSERKIAIDGRSTYVEGSLNPKKHAEEIAKVEGINIMLRTLAMDLAAAIPEDTTEDTTTVEEPVETEDPSKPKYETALRVSTALLAKVEPFFYESSKLIMGKLEQVMGLAKAKADAEDYAAGVKILNSGNKALNGAILAADSKEKQFSSSWTSAKSNLQKSRREVDSAMATLRSQIQREISDGDEELAEVLPKLDNLDDDWNKKLDSAIELVDREVDNKTLAKSTLDKVTKITKKFFAHLSNQQIRGIDRNGEVEIQMEDKYSAALETIETACGILAR